MYLAHKLSRVIKQRPDFIDIVPNNNAIVRVVGAWMLEAKKEWEAPRQHINLETLARVTADPKGRLPTVAV